MAKSAHIGRLIKSLRSGALPKRGVVIWIWNEKLHDWQPDEIVPATFENAEKRLEALRGRGLKARMRFVQEGPPEHAPR